MTSSAAYAAGFNFGLKAAAEGRRIAEERGLVKPMLDDIEPAEEPTLTDMLAAQADRLEGLLSMVIGYRTKAVEGGFSEYAAEELAIQIHAKLLED